VTREPIWLSVARFLTGAFRRAQRYGQRLLNAPAASEAQCERTERHVHAARPSSHCVSLTTELDDAGRGGIAGLFFWRGPSTVARLVIPVVVDAIDRVLTRRFRTHVSVEGREVIQPTVANPDSSAAVIGPLRGSRVQATALHRIPRSVFGRLLHPVRAMVRAVVLLASARSALLSSPCRDAHVARAAALTSAQPRLALRIVGQRGELADSFPADLGSCHLVILHA
jgi:hypothetical protein